MKQETRLVVNRQEYLVEVEPYETLAECLREKLGLIGVRVSCNRGDCGSCTVLLDGEPIASCMTLATEVDGRDITTIEGLARAGELHPIQRSFIEHHGMQCGFCTPGMILSAKALLDRNSSPGEDDVREAISGNLCRCGTYPKIVKSIMAAAKLMRV
ncbi:MAG: (2Fe-2S)-binding protein [Chloroflexi bacterium]|nr:(2Fe-2S)-binding protein [Chloroflexota bacterium]